jgi:hypothetical protein
MVSNFNNTKRGNLTTIFIVLLKINSRALYSCTNNGFIIYGEWEVTTNFFFDIQKNGAESLLETEMNIKYDFKKFQVYFPIAEMGFCVHKRSKIR